MENTQIHKTAVIHPEAKLGNGVSIGPYSVIGPNVTLGDNVQVSTHCNIEGKTTIGANCKIFTGAAVGGIPQDKKYNQAEEVSLVIGENNIIREYATIHVGTPDGGRKTVIGDNNLFMAYSHVAHDCVVGNNCVMANVGTLAGHVTLEDNAVVGGLSAVHQFVRLGRLSIIGGCSKVVQDIPPFSMSDGHPAKVFGLNLIGLRRENMSAKVISRLKQAFKILFYSGLSKTTAMERLESEIESCPEIDHLVFFVKTTKRGICG